MASLLIKVQRKMSIAAHRRVRGALEGEYSAVFKGRSMDFDDLREYVSGDDVKDIDWKATARSGQMLIKRYVAIRKYNILLVVDTGRSMAATAPSGDSKRDIAIMAAGIIGTVAQKHADLVGLVAGDNQQVDRMPLKDTLPHVERILQHINSHTRLDGPTSNLTNVLEYVKRTIKRRMMLIIISDSLQFAGAQEQLLRRLGAQHELLFIAVDDVDPSDPNWDSKDLLDVEQPIILPKYIRKQKYVADAHQLFLQTQMKTTSRLLETLQISNIRIKSESEALEQIVRLLEKQKHARR